MLREGFKDWDGGRQHDALERIADWKTMLIKVRRAKALGDCRLGLAFSDDMIGERDFGFILTKAGPMLEPLKDPISSLPARVSRRRRAASENGYDWDPIALHDEMKAAGQLRAVRRRRSAPWQIEWTARWCRCGGKRRCIDQQLSGRSLSCRRRAAHRKRPAFKSSPWTCRLSYPPSARQ